MPRISNKKREKVSEQILHHLFNVSPEAVFTSTIAQEIARDEEFTKSLLVDLKKKDFVIEVNKNQSGIDYLKRQRWRLSSQVFDFFSKRQSTNHSLPLKFNPESEKPSSNYSSYIN